MVRTSFVLCLLALLLMTTGQIARAQQREIALPPDHPCSAQLEEQLQFYGLMLAEMSDRQWQSQSEPGSTAVAGYRFSGRPASCASGGLAASFWADCTLIEMVTTGACRIEGLASQDF
jgi:hypothetical protein